MDLNHYYTSVIRGVHSICYYDCSECNNYNKDQTLCSNMHVKYTLDQSCSNMNCYVDLYGRTLNILCLYYRYIYMYSGGWPVGDKGKT